MARSRVHHLQRFPDGSAVRIDNGTLISTNLNSRYWPSFPMRASTCVDDLGRDKDHPLAITHIDRRLNSPLNGLITINATTTREFKNYYPSWIANDPLGHLSTPSIPTDAVIATAAVGRSNPSRPYVSIPNFVYELKDLPGMIKEIGNLKHLGKARKSLPAAVKGSASYYLSYQMGWAPLIRDLSDILGFQSAIDKKIRELHQLYDNGGIQRKVRSPQWSEVVSSNGGSFPVESLITSSITVKSQKITRRKKWATVRWYPSQLPDHKYSDQELAHLARQLVFGVKSPSIKQVWDAIPWTLLVGWFTNANDFMNSLSNVIPLSHSAPCVMTQTETTLSWNRTDSVTNVTGGDSVTFYTTKERSIQTGSLLSATLPFIGGAQLATLAALGIQRFKR